MWVYVLSLGSYGCVLMWGIYGISRREIELAWWWLNYGRGVRFFMFELGPMGVSVGGWG